jgi:hypothetical protein
VETAYLGVLTVSDGYGQVGYLTPRLLPTPFDGTVDKAAVSYIRQSHP